MLSGMTNEILNRWKRAIVHVEGATDQATLKESIEAFRELCRRLEAGEITSEQWQAEAAETGRRELRSRGTAIFVIHEQRHYLVTARHVLWNERQARGVADLFAPRGPTNPMMQHALSASMQEVFDNYIFGIIFLVSSYDEYLNQEVSEIPQWGDSLMNLGAGTRDSAPYTYSEPSIDLAVISLDNRDRAVTARLLERGYVPIPSDLIGDEPTCEGAEVFTVGFPAVTSEVARLLISPTVLRWRSETLSLPHSTYGRVSLLHPALPFFWADLTIYPGNSGGPVIEGDRLVGIVSAQASIPVELEGAAINGFSARVPLGKMIKAVGIRELLRQQEEKDRAWAERRGEAWP